MCYEIKNPEGHGRGWLRLLLATYLNQQLNVFFNEKELQMQLGFSTKTFKSLLEATGNPTLEIVEHIARMLNVPVWRLFFILDKSFENEINDAGLCFDRLACNLYGDFESYENQMWEMKVQRKLLAKE
jgi:hypothetical protein